MFIKEDNTYNEMREKSMHQWLSQLMDENDTVNRSGARLTMEYIEHLNNKIAELESKCALRDKFLKQLKERD